MKELKEKLLSKAKFNLTDDQYKTVETFINLGAWISLRVYLSDLAEAYQLRNMVAEQANDELKEWLAVEEMNDIAIEIAIQMNDRADDGIVKSRRKRISRRPETILQ